MKHRSLYTLDGKPQHTKIRPYVWGLDTNNPSQWTPIAVKLLALYSGIFPLPTLRSDVQLDEATFDLIYSFHGECVGADGWLPNEYPKVLKERHQHEKRLQTFVTTLSALIYAFGYAREQEERNEPTDARRLPPLTDLELGIRPGTPLSPTQKQLLADTIFMSDKQYEQYRKLYFKKETANG